MRFLRRLSPLGIVPAYMWLLLTTLMVGMPTSSAAYPVGQGAGTLASLHYYCTPSGLAFAPGQGGEEDSVFPHCKWCQGFGKSAPLLPPEIAVPIRERLLSQTVHAGPSAPALTPLTACGFQSRAPPLVLFLI